MSFDRQYLLNYFPAYDYNAPKEPWAMGTRHPDGLRNAGWLMQAFHYYWCIKQCQEEGQVGLSLGIPNLPFCLLADDSQRTGAHVTFGGTADNAYLIFNQETFPLVVASKALQQGPCKGTTTSGRCDPIHIVNRLTSWCELLAPGGVLIAALMDNRAPTSQKMPLHRWSPSAFYKTILLPLMDRISWITLEEFDTFKNEIAFNVVLRRITEEERRSDLPS